MAKARRRPINNPSIPRLEWVAKNYPDAVWLLTVIGFMEAAAMDDSRSIMEDEGASVVMNRVVESSLTYSGALSDGVAYQIREYGMENTEYDRYIPWLAKSLNRVTKKPVKKIKKIFSECYPGLLFDHDLPHVVKKMAEDSELLSSFGRKLNRKESDPTPILVDAFTAIHVVPDGGITDARYYLNESAHTEAEDLRRAMEGDISELTSSFGTVVRWAERARVNLDDYEPMEAVQLAKEWARSQPKDPDIVAGDVVYEFDDGWEFQELTTRPQFMCEGKYLDHCVGGYKPSKVGVVYRIFSLRDPQGSPMVTMRWEIDGEYVSQYYGMSNSSPNRDAVERAIEFRLRYMDPNLVTKGRGGQESEDWELWSGWDSSKPMPDVVVSGDALVRLALKFELQAPGSIISNPRRRRSAPTDALLKGSHRLWEAYDAKPLKRNLMAFGNHIEKMGASKSPKVKSESRRAARAFNAEIKERGWKR